LIKFSQGYPYLAGAAKRSARGVFVWCKSDISYSSHKNEVKLRLKFTISKINSPLRRMRARERLRFIVSKKQYLLPWHIWRMRCYN